MPVYKAPRHGVELSEAFHEAASIAPDDVVMVHTFELWHPSLAEPIYVVRNFEALLATKEADAERDPGLQVEFIAAPSLTLQRPAEADIGQTPELELLVPNVSGAVSRAIRLARGSPAQWEIVERIYNLGDTSGPAQTPMQLIVSSVQVRNTSVSMRCSYSDPANYAVPRTTFRRRHYPGLTR